MNTFMFCLIICIIICLILIWYASTYNKYQLFVIRINEAEANIDSVLRRRFDLLNKSIGIIKTNCKLDENVEPLDIIVKLRSKKISNFDLDRQLYQAINEFNVYIDKFPNLKKIEEFMKINIGINESEAEISAFRKYYNDIITDYNKLVKRFPSNIVALTCKYKNKTYFDGKDMSDDDIKDFKL